MNSSKRQLFISAIILNFWDRGASYFLVLQSHLARRTMLRASTYNKKKKTGEHHPKLTTRMQRTKVIYVDGLV